MRGPQTKHVIVAKIHAAAFSHFNGFKTKTAFPSKDNLQSVCVGGGGGGGKRFTEIDLQPPFDSSALEFNFQCSSSPTSPIGQENKLYVALM